MFPVRWGAPGRLRRRDAVVYLVDRRSVGAFRDGSQPSTSSARPHSYKREATMFATIRRYQVKPGYTEEVLRRGSAAADPHAHDPARIRLLLLATCHRR